MTTVDVDIQDVSTFARTVPGRLIANGFNVGALRTNALLHKDEWEELDTMIVQIAADELNGILDLRQFGLTVNLGGLGTIVSQYEQVSDMTPANVNMAAETDDAEDRVEFPLVGVPVPIISKPFRFDIRTLSASRQAGSGIDMTHAETATRKVAEGLENMLFNGSTVMHRGGTIYGYLNAPARNPVTGATWTTATNIYPNITAMQAALRNDNYRGPYRLYLGTTAFMQTLALIPNTSETYRDAIERLPGMGPGSVRESHYVPAGQGVMVTMRRDVVDLAIGQEIVPLEWEAKGGLLVFYKVFCAMVPRIKADAAGRSGVVHLTGIA